MPVIDDIRESQKKLKGKGFKYKLQYFWEYYRVATLITVVALVSVISIIYTIASNKESAFNALLINGYNSPSVEEFAQYSNIDLKKNSASMDYSYQINLSTDNYDETAFINVQKLMATITAQDADCIVGDTETVMNYADTEIYADLTKYFSQEELDALGDRVIYFTYKDDETGAELGTAPVAIIVTDAPQLVDNEVFVTKEVVFTIVANAKHPDKALEFYHFIYNK